MEALQKHKPTRYWFDGNRTTINKIIVGQSCLFRVTFFTTRQYKMLVADKSEQSDILNHYIYELLVTYNGIILHRNILRQEIHKSIHI